MSFYVYIWYDPIDGTPRYVGKGKGNRAWDHLQRKTRLGNLLRDRTSKGYEVVPEIRECVDEQSAFQLEIKLIGEIGRENLGKGPLFNLTDGGDGPAGQKMTAEIRDKISSSKKGRKLSPEHRAKISASMTGRVLSEESKKKISAKVTGHKRTDKTKQLISLAQKNKPWTKARREAHRRKYDKKISDN